MVATRRMPPLQGSYSFGMRTQGCAPSSLPLGYYILGFQPVRGTAHRSFRSFDGVHFYALLLLDSLLDDGSPLLPLDSLLVELLLLPPPPPPPPAASLMTRDSL